MKYTVAFAMFALVAVEALPTTLLAIEPANEVRLVDPYGNPLCRELTILATASRVITSADCVDGMPVTSLRVLVGSGDNQQLVSVTEYSVHENFNQLDPLSNNVAALSVSPPVIFSEIVQPIDHGTQQDLDQALHATEYLAVSEWIYTKIGGEDGGGSPPMICP